MAVLLLADGRLEADRLLRHAHDLTDLVHRHFQTLGDLLGAGVVAVLMQQLAGNLLDLVDGLDHMNGDADGAGLIGDGAGDCLTDPPCRIGGELEALGVVELLNSLDQTQIALLNQIQKLHAAADIALGDGNDQTQVCFAQALLGLLAIGAARLDLESQLSLLIGGEQRHTADLLQIDLDGVVDRDAVGGQAVLIIIGAVICTGDRIIDLHGGVVHDLDAVALKLLIELFHCLNIQNVAVFLHCIADLTAGQLADAAAGVNQRADRVFLLCHK